MYTDMDFELAVCCCFLRLYCCISLAVCFCRTYDHFQLSWYCWRHMCETYVQSSRFRKQSRVVSRISCRNCTVLRGCGIVCEMALTCSVWNYPWKSRGPCPEPIVERIIRAARFIPCSHTPCGPKALFISNTTKLKLQNSFWTCW